MLLKLGERLTSIRFDQLSATSVEKAKVTILNFFGGCLAGADSPLTRAEKTVWDSQGCRGGCVVVGSKAKTSALAAASVNA